VIQNNIFKIVVPVIINRGSLYLFDL